MLYFELSFMAFEHQGLTELKPGHPVVYLLLYVLLSAYLWPFFKIASFQLHSVLENSLYNLG